MTGLCAGSTAMVVMRLPFVVLRKRETPVIVPPVPTPATKMSTAPAVSSQISGPVVCSWMAGFVGLLYC